jgi:ubiquinone/menaquinone biosynthesis C-methylase UbiE
MPLHLNTSRSRWLVAGAVGAAAAAMYFGDKAPYPYPQHLLLDLPLPFLTSHSLDRILQPQPGERILEIGPGTGLQTLHVAPKLGPAGQLDIVDIQKEMLGHVMRQARRKELTTISPSLSDARNLPFGDNLFDAVYLVTALGEIPEPELVIAEAARVIKPSGRLVVGEFFDRHWIPFSRLRRMATESGFQIDDWSGPTLAYMARFRPIERDAPLAQSTFAQ